MSDNRYVTIRMSERIYDCAKVVAEALGYKDVSSFATTSVVENIDRYIKENHGKENHYVSFKDFLEQANRRQGNANFGHRR